MGRELGYRHVNRTGVHTSIGGLGYIQAYEQVDEEQAHWTSIYENRPLDKVGVQTYGKGD